MAVVKSILEINLSDGREVFLVFIYEPQKDLCIQLIDLNQFEAFSGKATDVDLRLQASSIRMTFSDFISLTTKALTINDSDDQQFLYSLEKSYEDVIFKWKSVDSDETIISIGFINVEKQNYTTVIKDVFSLLSEKLISLNKKLRESEANLRNAEKDKGETLNLLSNVTNIKETVEKELYSKFASVLNEKKRKIRDLKQSISDVYSKFPETLKSLKTLKSKPAKKARKMCLQISDSSEEVDDLEDINAPGPSNSKRNNSLLFLDDDEPALKVIPSKVRKRNAANVTKNRNSNEFTSDIKSKLIQRDSESEDELFNNL